MQNFTLTNEQLRKATDAFKTYDRKNADKIAISDLANAFRDLHIVVNEDTLEAMVDSVDEQATGFIKLDDFVTLYTNRLQEEADIRELKEAFRVLDKEKRGEIAVNDLKWILQSLGDDLTEEDIDEMIRDTDTDGSGTVDFDEFYRLMTSE